MADKTETARDRKKTAKVIPFPKRKASRTGYRARGRSADHTADSASTRTGTHSGDRPNARDGTRSGSRTRPRSRRTFGQLLPFKRGRMRLRLPERLRCFIRETEIRMRLTRTSGDRQDLPQWAAGLFSVLSRARDGTEALTPPDPPDLDHPVPANPLTHPAPPNASTPPASPWPQSLQQFFSLDGFVVVLIALILLLSPYLGFNGSHQASMLAAPGSDLIRGGASAAPYPVYMLIAAIFALYALDKARKRKLKFFRGPLDYAVFLLPLIAALSIPGAWDTRGAVNLALLLACCAALYWLTSNLYLQDTAYLLLTALFAGAVLISIRNLAPVFQGTAATLEALGAYLSASFLCGLYLISVYQRLPARLALSGGCFLILLTALALRSWVTCLVLLLGTIFLLIGSPKESRRKMLGQALIPAAIAAPTTAHAASTAVTPSWLWLCTGLFLVLTLQYTWHRMEQYTTYPQPTDEDNIYTPGQTYRRLRPWVTPAAALLLSLVVMIGAGAYINNALSQSPQSSITLEEGLLRSRDALRIMTSDWRTFITGTGGGGWNAVYHKYQSVYYQGEVPGAFWQAGVELGIPGIITLIAVWAFFLLLIRRTMFQPTQYRRTISPQTSAITTAALAIGCHSILGCGFSPAALSLFLFTLFGLGSGPGLSQNRAPEPLNLVKLPILTKKFLPQNLALIALPLLVFIISLSLFLGEGWAKKAESALQRGNNPTAALYFLNRATAHDPFNSFYRKELGRFYMERGSHHEAQEQFKKGLLFARGDVDLRLLYANSLFETGQLGEGIRQLEQAQQLSPLRQDLYENLAVGCLTAGLITLEQASQASPESLVSTASQGPQLNKKEAAKYLTQTLAVPETLEKQRKKVKSKNLRRWEGVPYLGVSPKIELCCGEAAALLGKWQMAERYLKGAAADDSLKPEALLWQGLTLAKMKRESEGEEMIHQALELKPELAAERGRLEKLFP